MEVPETIDMLYCVKEICSIYSAKPEQVAKVKYTHIHTYIHTYIHTSVLMKREYYLFIHSIRKHIYYMIAATLTSNRTSTPMDLLSINYTYTHHST